MLDKSESGSEHCDVGNSDLNEVHTWIVIIQNVYRNAKFFIVYGTAVSRRKESRYVIRQ